MNNLDLTLNEVATAIDGRLFNAGASAAAPPFSELVTDSRKVSANCVFLCILGERVDGHDFIPECARAGAGLIIGDNAQKIEAAAKTHPGTAFLSVPDSLLAVQKLAEFYRRKFSIPVMGLTGSSGKTTTKDLLASILGGDALVTEGTLNNHWGVPQMVLRLRREHRMAAFEMGTSGFGEIASLSAICQPQIGYITTIGSSHLEKLKDKDGVLRAKRELFDWIVAHAKERRTLIFNLDDPYLAKLHQEFVRRGEKNLRLITLSMRGDRADVRLTSRKALGIEDRFGWAYELATPWGAIAGKLPLPGLHNLSNAMAAASLALATGEIQPAQVVSGLANPRISKLRSDLFQLGSGAVVYNDSYNANPTSVAALLEAAREIRQAEQTGLKRTVAAVGDMLELGPDSGDMHREMGALAADQGVDVLLATGSFAKDWLEGYLSRGRGKARAFGSREDLLVTLRDEINVSPSTTLVIVKGSRGAKMDQVVEKLREAAPRA